MSGIVASIHGEFIRYKALGEGAIAQLRDDELSGRDQAVSNSVAVLVWHLSGNLASRFTDFLTADGEKPWRDRDSEFSARTVGREEVLAKWEAGWQILFDAIAPLRDADLERVVTIRGTPFRVHEALHRALAHTSYHVGQIVYIAKQARGADWHWLSIAPGQSETYNRNPTRERPDAHAATLHSRAAARQDDGEAPA